jgi:predicted phage terminase large subunit-like protein
MIEPSLRDIQRYGINPETFEELKRRINASGGPSVMDSDFHHIRGGLEGGDHNTGLLGGPDPALMPLAGSFNAYQQHQIEEIGQNFKLTPATLAFRLENKRLGPNDPLKWYPSPFLMYISKKIATGIVRGNARIIISAPPRHGKSRISTIHGPLWCLETFANKNIVTTTYGADLSEDFARAIRDYIYDNPDDLDVRIRDDASRLAKFLTNKGGALTSIGIGGPITGRGADVLLIDDFIKQIKEALSPTYRQYVWDWFTTTAMTRLEPNASVIIIATRWHHDDLIGRIIKKFGTKEEGGDWDYIKFHATARENDPLGRSVGEPLFPQRYSAKVLKERETLLGKVYYDAIFDQEPHESDSDLTDKSWVKRFHIRQLPETNLRLVRVWDFAGSEDLKADFTAGGLYAGDIPNKNVYLLNMIRDQLTPAKVQDLVEQTAEADGPGVEIVICQETGSAGKAVVDFYARNVLKGYKVVGQYWNTNKLIVAQPFLAACEAGHFYMLEGEEWNEAFLTEFEHFPAVGAGYHDDQMDTSANAYIRLFGKTGMKTTWGRNSRSAQQILSNLPKDPVEAALIATKAAKAAKSSPHTLLKQGKSASFSTMRGATFGRKSRDYYN